MKIQTKILVSLGGAAVFACFLVFALFYWKTNSYLRENAVYTNHLLEEVSQERQRSDSMVHAVQLESLLHSMFQDLEILNLFMLEANRGKGGEEGIPPLMSALEQLAREKGFPEGRYLPPEVESIVTITEDQGNIRNESCTETNHYTTDTVIPKELQNFRKNFFQTSSMLVVPRGETGYLWAASGRFSTRYQLAAYKINVKRLLSRFARPDISSLFFLMHGHEVTGICKQGEEPFLHSGDLKVRMQLLASRLVSIMGKRHYEQETVVQRGTGQRWTLAAITLQMVTTPARELRLVQAQMVDPGSSAFLRMGSGSFLFLMLFILLGLLVFSIPLLVCTRNLSNALNRILDFTSRLSRGEEQPENLRAGNSEEIQEISSNLNHLRDKFASLTVRLKKSHEREILARSDAENSNRMKSVLLNDMVTELQDPVSLMISFSGLLLHKLKNQEEYQMPLRKIHEEALSANRLLSALGNLAEVDLSNGDPSYSEFDVSELVREISDACVPLSSERHVSFETSCSDLPERIISDRVMMRRLLQLAATTLLSVAPPKTRVRWTCTDREQEIAFRFYDTRTAESLSLADLFNERMQFAASRRFIPGYAAPILNLTIIKFQAAILGARFTVKRTKESNTEIELVFPKQDPMDIVLSGDREQEENMRHARTSSFIFSPDRNRKVYLHDGRHYEMLVADKSASSFMMFSIMLENEPCTLTHAATPEECLRLLKENHFDFLLLDLNFQKAFCTPLLAAIRTGSTNPNLIILGIASGLTEAEHAAILESGVDVCLRKPVSVENLVSAIHGYIGQ